MKMKQGYVWVPSDELEIKLEELMSLGKRIVSVVKRKGTGRSGYLIIDECDPNESVAPIDTSKPLDYSNPKLLGACFGNDTIEVEDGNANILVRVGLKRVVLNVDILEHVTDYGTLYLVVRYLDQNILLYLNGNEGVFKFGYLDEVYTNLKTPCIMDADAAIEYVRDNLPKEDD